MLDALAYGQAPASGTMEDVLLTALWRYKLESAIHGEAPEEDAEGEEGADARADGASSGDEAREP